MDFGKTRPLLPTKVSSPRSSHQRRSVSGGNSWINGAQKRFGLPVAREERRQVFAVGQVQAASASHQEFARGRGHAVDNHNAIPVFGQALRSKEAGRTGTGNQDVEHAAL